MVTEMSNTIGDPSTASGRDNIPPAPRLHDYSRVQKGQWRNMIQGNKRETNIDNLSFQCIFRKHGMTECRVNFATEAELDKHIEEHLEGVMYKCVW